MRVLICGVDGYLGWSLAQYLAARGHDVGGVDAGFRRKWVEEMGSDSATPILTMPERLEAFKEIHGQELRFWDGDLTKWDVVEEVFRAFEPDAVVHLGECPSAPYSMIDREHTVWVQTNNVVNTLNLQFAIRDLQPSCH